MVPPTGEFAASKIYFSEPAITYNRPSKQEAPRGYFAKVLREKKNRRK